MWLARFIDRWLDGGDGAGEQARRVQDVLDGRGAYADDAALFEALLRVMPAGEPLEQTSLAHIVRALRVDPAGEVDLDPDAELAFWAALGARFPDDAYIQACWGDGLRASDRRAEGLERLLRAFELDPSLVDEFADDVELLAERSGGQVWLRYRICDLRSRLDDPDQSDDIRELYSELLEDHRDDPASMARLRALGRQINELTAEDKLPRAIVRRTRTE
jgi:hypothetical protein